MRVGAKEGLRTGLVTTGLALSDVTHVLMTHGHADHVGGLPFLSLKPRFGSKTSRKTSVRMAVQTVLWIRL